MHSGMTHTDSPSDPRAEARAAFLNAVGKGAAELEALPVDASFRRYFRLLGSNPAVLLMDAPAPNEDIRPFIRIARHLKNLGLSAPEIFDFDEDNGFALIEDFGGDTYTRLLDAGADAAPLFTAATDALVILHTDPRGAAVEALPYDRAKLLEEVSELPDWYGLAVNGIPLSDDVRDRFVGLWADLLDSLPPPETGLVLLDYHVDNLMLVAGRGGVAACGLLDFQDARIGPRPYDLLCLLRNERRGIDPALSQRLYDHYIAAARPADVAGFGLWYRVLAAQRYTKVAGRFARLTLRDGRDGYLRYMPRVLSLLADALDAEPLLWPIRRALAEMLPAWRELPTDNPAMLRRRVASGAGRS
jgi:aminoglycoside/choline kinase family phosphotransferase